jgi:hypothetical protein
MELLNANQRLHWAPKARITKTIRDAAHILTRQAKVPRLESARIVCVYEPNDQRRRDRSNWHPSAKAAVDGVVDAGVLADDSDRYLDGPHIKIGEVHPRGRLVLHITEVTP